MNTELKRSSMKEGRKFNLVGFNCEQFVNDVSKFQTRLVDSLHGIQLSRGQIHKRLQESIKNRLNSRPNDARGKLFFHQR